MVGMCNSLWQIAKLERVVQPLLCTIFERHKETFSKILCTMSVTTKLSKLWHGMSNQYEILVKHFLITDKRGTWYTCFSRKIKNMGRGSSPIQKQSTLALSLCKSLDHQPRSLGQSQPCFFLHEGTRVQTEFGTARQGQHISIAIIRRKLFPSNLGFNLY